MAKTPITPEFLARSGTEHGEQAALFCWTREAMKTNPLYFNLFAIPNGGDRPGIAASRMAAEGVKSGVHDVFLPVPLHGFHGLFIEMKRRGTEGTVAGDYRQAQYEWRTRFLAQGYACELCHGWLKARLVLRRYFGELQLPYTLGCANEYNSGALYDDGGQS